MSQFELYFPFNQSIWYLKDDFIHDIQVFNNVARRVKKPIFRNITAMKQFNLRTFVHFWTGLLFLKFCISYFISGKFRFYNIKGITFYSKHAMKFHIIKIRKGTFFWRKEGNH